MSRITVIALNQDVAGSRAFEGKKGIILLTLIEIDS